MSDPGKIEGKIIGCVSAATVNKNSKSNCRECGGIVGRNDEATVKNCLYTGTTVSSDSYVGAIAGWNYNGSLTNNYYTASSLGGVNGNDQDGARLARTVTLGENIALIGSETPYEIQNHSSLTAIGTTVLRYYDGNSTTLYSGEGQTLTLSYTGDPVTTTGYAAMFSTNGTRFEGNAYTIPAADVTITVAATDVWGVSNTPAADGSAEHPYLIGSKTALDLLAKNVNGTDGYSANEFSGKHFRQTTDLTYDGTENRSAEGRSQGENYTPIGKSNRYFRGHYDGGGNTVSGININTTGNDVGLFGYVYTPGTVENVTLANSTIKGFTDVGGIVGFLYGDQFDPDVSNCRVESDVTIGAGSGSAPNHGGIVGRMQCGIISGCYSAATITDNDKNNCKDFGGIVGYIEGSVTEVKDCLFTGTIVTTSTKKGGIVATITDGSTLTNNYYTDSSLSGVTIPDNYADIPIEKDELDFIGVTSSRAFTINDKSNLFLGMYNMLFWPDATNDIDRTKTTYDLYSCRAYFHLKDIMVTAREFKLNFGEDNEASGITTTDYTDLTDKADAWHTLDGRKLGGKPMKSGLYIHGNRKVMIK